MPRFLNRTDAGRLLAERLAPLAGRKDVQLLALPAGGVVVAAEVARILDLPLAGFVVCPMKVAGSTPQVIGAVVSGGMRVLDQDLLARLALPRRLVDEESEVSQRALAREERRYRLDHSLPSLAGKTVVLIDEWAESGATLVAAIRALRWLRPASIVAAAPMMPAVAACHVAAVCDRCVTVRIAPTGMTRESAYAELEPVMDEEIQALLQAHQSIGQPA